MMKRNEEGETASRLTVEEFGSSSGKGVGQIESVVEVDPVSGFVSPAEAEAAEAPSPPLWISIDSSTSVCVDNGDEDEL